MPISLQHTFRTPSAATPAQTLGSCSATTRCTAHAIHNTLRRPYNSHGPGTHAQHTTNTPLIFGQDAATHGLCTLPGFKGNGVMAPHTPRRPISPPIPPGDTWHSPVRHWGTYHPPAPSFAPPHTTTVNCPLLGMIGNGAQRHTIVIYRRLESLFTTFTREIRNGSPLYPDLPSAGTRNKETRNELTGYWNTSKDSAPLNTFDSTKTHHQNPPYQPKSPKYRYQQPHRTR